MLVWLHGGAWISGAGSLDWYDGANLAREGDIVFVGVNYRLGALGWLHRPGIVDVEAGTSDMIAALTWVRDHIAAFGGDPRCVTVMGQSAGATSIGRLLMLPEARALFHRVIMQSGGFGRGAYTRQWRPSAPIIIAALDIDPQSSDALARFRGVDVPRLLAAQGHWRGPMLVSRRPSAVHAGAAIAHDAGGDAGRDCRGADGKPVLIGATADEVHAFFAADPAMQDCRRT